ncbi:MAG: hypothetical protein GY719_09540 [bacterium]|nr:hypothetical protein [bacterium]
MADTAFCGLLPHPPIIVPEVGRERLEECRSTERACRDFADRMMATRPDRLFMVSPHSPRRGGDFGLWTGERLRGDLGRFGAPGSNIDLPNDPMLANSLRAAAYSDGLGTWSISGSEPLDHGAVVPLWFLAQAGWQGPTCIASLPWSEDPGVMQAFGRALATALASLDGRAALIASGDMSHKVLPGAPAGFHPRAVEFDHALRDLVAEGALDRLSEIDPELRRLAAEDAADSSMIVAAAIDYRAHGVEVVSYEHPFGVGYLVAVFHDGREGA